MDPLLLIAGSSLLSGFLGAKASSDAAKAQGAAADKAANATTDAAALSSATQLQMSRESIAAQQRLYDLSRFDSAPWRAIGAGALAKLAGYPSSTAAFGVRTPPATTAPQSLPAPSNVLANPTTLPLPTTQPAGSTGKPGMAVNLGGIEGPQAAPTGPTDANGRAVYSNGGRAVYADGSQAHGSFESHGNLTVAAPPLPGIGTQGVRAAGNGTGVDENGNGIENIDDPTGASRAPGYNALTDAPIQYTASGAPIFPAMQTPSLLDRGVNAFGNVLAGSATIPGRIANYAAEKFPNVVQNDPSQIAFGGSAYVGPGGTGGGVAGNATSQTVTAGAGGGNVLNTGGITAPAGYDPTAAGSDLGPTDVSGEFFNASTYNPSSEFTGANRLNVSPEFLAQHGYTPSSEFSTAHPFDPSAEFKSGFQYDANQLNQDPGYQFRLQQGLKAIGRSSNALGVSQGSRGYKGLIDYASGSASQEYSAAYQRAYADFVRRQQQEQTSYVETAADRAQRQALEQSTFAQNYADLERRQQTEQNVYQANTADLSRRQGLEADTYNAAQADRTARFNRLAALAGVGQTAAAQTGAGASQLGAGIAGTLANTGNALSQGALSTGAQLGQIYQGAGNAQAGGIVGGANALNSTVQGGLSNYFTYQQIQNQQAQQASDRQFLTGLFKPNNALTGTA